MTLGMLALLFAAGAAGWLLLRVARGEGPQGGGRNVTLLKLVILLGLVAALFAVKLWPLAFMVLLAVGGVMAIEFWRSDRIENDKFGEQPSSRLQRTMTIDEATAMLGLGNDAGPDEIRAAHRRLIAQIHPDKGGTDYLAAKINEARDLLLRQSEKQ